MKIKYNEIEQSIEIQDELKTHYTLLKIVMVLNIVSAVFQLIDINETGFGVIEFIFLSSGILSLTVLYFLIFKISTRNKIPVKKIERLSEKSVLGRKRFSLRLSDGKKRDLITLKTQTEFDELKKLFTKIGIAS